MGEGRGLIRVRGLAPQKGSLSNYFRRFYHLCPPEFQLQTGKESPILPGKLCPGVVYLIKKNKMKTTLLHTNNRYLRIFTLLALTGYWLAGSSTATAQCRAKFSTSVSGSDVLITDSSTAAHFFTKSWVFGDGTHSDLRTAQFKHTYSTKKDTVFQICLKIYDTVSHCSDGYCDWVKVKATTPPPPPTGCRAKFGFSVSGGDVTFTDSSSAAHFFKKSWSFGDGTSSDNGSASFIHTYKANGGYKVCLKITDTVNQCTMELCTAVIINRPVKYHISGNVDADRDAAYPGTVWLIVFNPRDSSLKAIKDTRIVKDSAGAHYTFTDVDPGIYYTKAAMDTGSIFYKHFLPTYCESAVKWAKANKITVVNADVPGRNIHLQRGLNPGGKGFIGGKISQGANKTVGDPISGVQVMLLDDMDNTMDYTYSGADGSYSFSDLAYGKYKVYAEVLGLPTYPAELELTEDNQGETDINIKVNSSMVYSDNTTTGIESVSPLAGTIAAYPNPVKDNMNVLISTSTAQKAILRIYDINGRQLLSQTQSIQAGSQSISVKTNTLPAGMYMVRIQLEGYQSLSTKFVKMQ
jgi:hypothetical protein